VRKARNCPLCTADEAEIVVFAEHALAACRRCGLVFAPEVETNPSLYDEAYEEGGEYSYYRDVARRAESGDLRLPWPMRRFLATIQPVGRLLDVGCSTGRFLLAARRRGWDVAGVEPSASAAAVARRLADANVTVGSVEEVGTAQFDAVTAWEVLEHTPDPVPFLRRLIGALKAGGVLALSIPNWGSPWTRKSRKTEHWPPYHLTFWCRGTTLELARRVGLEAVTVREKPFAWTEEVGKLKWVLLPLSLARAGMLGQRGMHLLLMGRRPLSDS
jgi:SAM-dependent methyltransferase